MEGRAETQLVPCKCVPTMGALPTNASDCEYVSVKKKFMTRYLSELILHSNPSLVRSKPCYGKQHGKVYYLDCLVGSHGKDLKRLKNYLNKEPQRVTALRFPKKVILAEDFHESFHLLGLTFKKILSTFYEKNDLIPIQFLIESVKSELLTLSVFESILNHYSDNGNGIRENGQTISENRSIQLEESTDTPV